MRESLPLNLRENPFALSHFVHQAPIALAMFDLEMRYVAVSRPWIDLFKVGVSDIIGRSHYDLFPDLPDAWRDAHRRGMQGEHLSNSEAAWTTPDGTTVWRRWDLAPWRNEKNEIGGITLFVEDISTPKAIDAVLRLVSVDASRMWFPAFANHAARRISEILGVDMVQLAQPCADMPGWAETTAVWADGKAAPNYRYPLADTPCDLALQRNLCIFDSAVQLRFPEDDDLQRLGMEAYGGTALLDGKGKMLGVLAVMKRTPFRDPELVRSVLTLAGIAIGGNLERHHASSAVEASERFSRSLLDAMNSHIAVLDGTGKIIFANEAWFAFARDSGAAPAATGIGADYLKACEAAAFASTEAREAASLLREVLSGQKTEGSCEYPCPTPSGMTWYRCTIKRFANLDQTMVLAAHENVSDVRQANLRSEQVETKFRHLFDDAPDAALIVDDEGVIRMANRQAELLYRFEPGMLEGVLIRTLISDENETRPIAVMEDFAERLAGSSQGTAQGATQGARRDGSTFPAEFSLSRFIEYGETLFIVAVRDVSLRVAAEADRQARLLAEQANQAKSVFLATMSHEIRTPLNAVLGFAEVLSHSSLNPDQAGMLKHMHASAQHLLGLIDNVLDLSKIEAGELELEEASFELPALILSNARALSGYAAQRNVRINLFIAPDMPRHIRSDPSRLRQVVYNLLGNAIKFSTRPDGEGRVQLRARATGTGTPMLELLIQDNGIGMTEEVRARVFQPFVQGESSVTRRYGGTGLGLTITKRIVEAMGGQIDVDSTSGLGSTFRVTIPFCAATDQHPQLPQRLKGLHCLLAENAVYQADDLAQYLHHEGAQITRITRGGGDTALPASAATADVLICGPDFCQPLGLATDLACVLICDRSAEERGGTAEAVTCLRPELLTCDTLVRAVQRACGHGLKPLPELPASDDGGTDGEVRRFDPALYQPILVVEDDPMNQKVILRQLALLGLEPDLADDGVAALQKIEKKHYGLILADLNMPVMDGYTMTAEIRAREAAAGVSIDRTASIVALTANVLRDEMGRTREAGFDGFLTKPMTLNQLAATIAAFLPPASGH
ncbi:MAG: PAS domain S-box protein [Pararhodobacter sp.]|nr:PAS domain S-box protein [Pararhodobacter sp.]